MESNQGKWFRINAKRSCRLLILQRERAWSQNLRISVKSWLVCDISAQAVLIRLRDNCERCVRELVAGRGCWILKQSVGCICQRTCLDRCKERIYAWIAKCQLKLRRVLLFDSITDLTSYCDCIGGEIRSRKHQICIVEEFKFANCLVPDERYCTHANSVLNIVRIGNVAPRRTRNELVKDKF